MDQARDENTNDLFDMLNEEGELPPSNSIIKLDDAIDPAGEQPKNTKKPNNVTYKKTPSPSSPSSPPRVAEVTSTSTGDEGTKKNHDGDTSAQESKLAENIADCLRDRLCYDEKSGEWFAGKGGLWSCVSEKRALKIIMSSLDSKLPSGYAINKLNNIKSFLMIYLLLDDWESARHLLPMANGVLDTKSMTLSAYSHRHRFNWQLPYGYDSDSKLDVISRWLLDATENDDESIQIIRAFFKIALIGGDAQKFLELIGAGGTGKSTLVRLLVAFIGDKNHAATDLKNLETNRFEAAALYGKRLALISDSSRYGGEVSVLKAITGGDPVRFEKKNQQQSGSFVFGGVVVVASNEAIQTADYTSGLIRRRMPVTFNRKVTDADKAKWTAIGGIEAAMHKELPGLLNWVLQMTDDDVGKVIGGINGQMTQAQREHLADTNKIAAWLDDNIIINIDSIVYVGKSMKKECDESKINIARREKLYPNYEQWCDDCAVNPVALQRFTANVLDVCSQLNLDVIAKDKTNQGRPIKGLAIRREFHFTYASPVTRKIFGDGESVYGDEAMTKQTLGGDDGDEGDDVLLSLTNTDSEVF
jgi:putative DNA primase/helicase